MILPKILSANNEIKTTKEAYEQMTLVQKKIYLLRLFESNLTLTTSNGKEEKRILERQLEQNCGFGCVMHHVSYCLSIASGSGRTLIFEDEGNKWAYNVQWNEIFEQITNCSYLENVKPFLPIPIYSEPGQSDRIVFLDRRWDMCR
uniref:GT23 domain-containing protein n=1 Tax=Meloidogyne floridensis TaxID=298350 RepID=A0A915NIX2_9BILA